MRKRYLVYQTAGSCYIVYLTALLRFFHYSGQLVQILLIALPFFLYFMYAFWKQLFQEDSADSAEQENIEKTPQDAKAHAAGRMEILLIVSMAAAVLAVSVYYEGAAGSSLMPEFAAYSRWVQADPARMQTCWLYSMVYYLHTAFRLDEFMLFRVFWAVQALLSCFTLAAFLQLCFRLRYTAYLAAGACIMLVFLQDEAFISGTVLRHLEFGMFYILPPAAFLLLFLEAVIRGFAERKNDKEENKENKDEEGVYLLDEVLKRTAEQEALKETLQTAAGSPESSESAGEAAGEVVLIMEKGAADGTLSIKECPLDGTFSIKDASISIEEIAGHASGDIPLLDARQNAGAYAARAGHDTGKSCLWDSICNLLLFALAFGMAVSAPQEMLYGQTAALVLTAAFVCVGFHLVKKMFSA